MNVNTVGKEKFWGRVFCPKWGNNPENNFYLSNLFEIVRRILPEDTVELADIRKPQDDPAVLFHILPYNSLR